MQHRSVHINFVNIYRHHSVNITDSSVGLRSRKTILCWGGKTWSTAMPTGQLKHTALCLASKAPVIWPHQPLASIPGPVGIFMPVLLPSPLLELSPPFPTSIQSLLLLQGPAWVLSSPGTLSWPLQVQEAYLLCNLQHLLLTTQLGFKFQSWSCFLGPGFCPPTPPPHPRPIQSS